MKFKLTLATLLIATCAFAGDVTGKWTAAVQGPDGQMEIVFNFKQDGTKLTGTASSQMGEMAISEGKVDGATITFTVATDQFKVVHQGTVDGDEIKIKADVGGQQMDMTAKRTK